MGKRRLRLLNKIDSNNELFGVDERDERRLEAETQAIESGFHIKTFATIEEVNENIDAVIISTPPLSHYNIIKKCLINNWNVFTELNLVASGYDEAVSMAKKRGIVLFLSSTPLFRRENQYLINRVNDTPGSKNYIYHVGQYLPDWHPWEDYRSFFAGQKKTNGCREILAVELPWIVKCFGEIKSIKAVSARHTDLNIDFCDCHNILIEHERGNTGVFISDVVCRQPVRRMEIYGEKLYLLWNGMPDGISDYNMETGVFDNISVYSEIERLSGYNKLIIENAYEEELKDFFGVIEKRKTPRYSFEKDKEILRWIDEVEGWQN